MRLFKKALSFEFATRTEWQKKNVFLACLKQCILAKKKKKFGEQPFRHRNKFWEAEKAKNSMTEFKTIMTVLQEIFRNTIKISTLFLVLIFWHVIADLQCLEATIQSFCNMIK